MTDRHHISSKILKQNIHKERRRTFYVILVLDIWICSSGAAVVTDCPGGVDLQKHVNMTCTFGNEPVRESFRIGLMEIVDALACETSNSTYMKTYVCNGSEDVLTCQWQQTKHLCIPRPGYGYYPPITNSVVLFIANVSSENLGSYSCQRIQSDMRETPCEIKLRDPFDITTVEISGSQTTVPKEVQDPSNVSLIVGLCVGLLIFAALVIVISVYYIKIKRPGMSREQEMSPVKSETEHPQKQKLMLDCDQRVSAATTL